METPEFFQADYYNARFPDDKPLSDAKNGDNFVIEDLLDIPNDDCMAADDSGMSFLGTSTDSASTVTMVDTSCNSSFSGGSSTVELEPQLHSADVGGGVCSLADGNCSSELCVPYDDLAELEWLSNFTEESFSSEDLQKLQLIQGLKGRKDENSDIRQYRFQPEITRACPILHPEMSVPAKARSKRSRTTTAGKYWASRILAAGPSQSSNTPVVSSSSSLPDIVSGSKTASPSTKEGSGDGRKCLHCATDKTPQWRTGPMGPKTLCNACGVRFKSGRLVPEYRPAASPTFVLTKHSNSHRKVLELRRQKEQVRVLHHHHHQNMMFHVTNGDDYLVHQHVEADFRQLI